MKKLITGAAATFALTICVTSIQAQNMSRMDNKQLLRITDNLAMHADRLDGVIDRALDRSRLDGSAREDDVLALVDEFENETDQLRDRIDDNAVVSSDVEAVLSRGLRLQMFLERHPAIKRDAQPAWMMVRNNLDQLARAYNVTWVWTTAGNTYMKNIPVKQVLRRIEERADEFDDSLEIALDSSRLDGSPAEDQVLTLVHNFEEETDELRDRANNRPGGGIVAADVEALMKRALEIEKFMDSNQLTPRANRDWAQVKVNLDELAQAYNVVPVWTVTFVPATSSIR
ncbi:MAG: hypothetical protein MSG64_05570 [Pyrinomonadaceae bacterium MAG19_C2-C3]|nr:hypothetical protein [Pyrinomonadaceae bacterium MAG19_C2-C3]